MCLFISQLCIIVCRAQISGQYVCRCSGRFLSNQFIRVKVFVPTYDVLLPDAVEFTHLKIGSYNVFFPSQSGNV